jgi:hypothetical protein
MSRILTAGFTAPITSNFETSTVRKSNHAATSVLIDASTFEVFHSTFEPNCSTFEPSPDRHASVGMGGQFFRSGLGGTAITYRYVMPRPSDRSTFDAIPPTFEVFNSMFEPSPLPASSRFVADVPGPRLFQLPACPWFDSGRRPGEPAPQGAKPLSLVPMPSAHRHAQRPSPSRAGATRRTAEPLTERA